MRRNAAVILVVFCCLPAPDALQPEQGEARSFEYRFREGQGFRTVSRVMLTSQPSPDAPKGIHELQDVILHYRVVAVAESGDAELEVQLEYLLLRNRVRGRWIETLRPSALEEQGRVMRVRIVPTGQAEPVALPDEPEPQTPMGSLDLPPLPATALTAGGTWTVRGEVGRPDVEGLFLSLTHGRFDGIDAAEDGEAAVFQYEKVTYGENLPIKSNSNSQENIQLKAHLAESREVVRRVMVYDLDTCMPIEIESVTIQEETRVATIVVNGEEITGGKPHHTQTESFSRTRFFPGKREIEELRAVLDSNPFFRLDQDGPGESPPE